jgi:hypothetical protein
MFNLNRKLGINCVSQLIKQQKDVCEIIVRSKSSCISCLNQRLITNSNKKPFQYQIVRNKS